MNLLIRKVTSSPLLQFSFMISFAVIFIVGFSSGYILKGDQDLAPSPGQIDRTIKGLVSENTNFNLNELAKKQFQNDKAGIKWSVLAEDQVSGIQLVAIQDQIGMHIHKTEDHYTYIVSGSGEYDQDGKKIILEPGVFILTKSKIPHRVKNKGQDPLILLVFSTPRPFEEDDIEWTKADGS